jgi:release factor glutamine methyltransferase
MTINQFLKKGTAPHRPPVKETELIIAHILGKSREFVLSHPEYELSDKQLFSVKQLWQKLSDGMPLAYVLRKKEFYGLDFFVDQRVLIPRPETELMIELGYQILLHNDKKPWSILDIGTGSGCIAVALAHLTKQNSRLKKIKLLASDISPAALTVARKNAKKHLLSSSIKFYQSDLLSSYLENPYLLNTPDILIMANLPYLSKEIYHTAPPSVTAFEPKQALLSGEEGLDHYEKLLQQIKKFKNINPQLSFHLLLEISPEQKKLLSEKKQLTGNNTNWIFHQDLAGKWRIAEISL